MDAFWRPNDNNVNEKHKGRLVLEFETLWCKMERNSVKCLVRISKLFLLLYNTQVTDTNLHIFFKFFQNYSE